MISENILTQKYFPDYVIARELPYLQEIYVQKDSDAATRGVL